MRVNTTARAPFLWVGVARSEAEPAAYWSALQADSAALRDVDALFDRPTLHCVAFDRARDAGLFVRLDKTSYRSASFLDHARLAPLLLDPASMIGVPRENLIQRVPAAPLTTHYIFHTAHCGSTLLSRALAAVSNCLPLREPPVLRWAAEAQRSAPQAQDTADCLALSAALVGRRFDPSAPAVVKATSWASNLGMDLLARDPGARALCLYQSLDEHVIALLPYAESDVQAAARTAQEDLGLTVEPRSSPEQIALGWVGRAWSMHQLEGGFPGRVAFLSRQSLLASPAESLLGVVEHFGLTVVQPGQPLLAPEVWQRSAKAPSEPFDAAAWGDLQARGRATFAAEIDAAQRLVDELCSRHPPLCAAIERLQVRSTI